MADIFNMTNVNETITQITFSNNNTMTTMMNLTTMTTNSINNNDDESSTLLVNYVYQTTAEYYTTFAVGFFGSLLSLYGSCTIIYLALKRRPSIFREPDQLYHRLVLGLSIMDSIFSFTTLFQPFLNRVDTGVPLARGNATSCAFGGFFFQFFIGSTLYNCWLSLYYLATIRYKQTKRTLSKRFEPWIHIIAFGIPLLFGIVGLALHLFNPSLLVGICEFAPHPWNCVENDDIPCDAGLLEDEVTWGHVTIYILSSIVGIIATWLVYWTVRTQTNKGRRWTTYTPTTSTATSNGGGRRSSFSSVLNRLRNISQQQQQQEQQEQSNNNGRRSFLSRCFSKNNNNQNNQNTEMDHAQRKRIRAVAIQAICYMMAYIIAFASALFLSVINAIYTPGLRSADQVRGVTPIFISVFLLYLLFPIQGALNCIIYIRPRWVRWKEQYHLHHPQQQQDNDDNNNNKEKQVWAIQQWWWAYRQVLSGKVPPPMTNSNRRNNNNNNVLIRTPRVSSAAASTQEIVVNKINDNSNNKFTVIHIQANADDNDDNDNEKQEKQQQEAPVMMTEDPDEFMIRDETEKLEFQESMQQIAIQRMEEEEKQEEKQEEEEEIILATLSSSVDKIVTSNMEP